MSPSSYGVPDSSEYPSEALGGREGADRVEARVRDDRDLTGRDVALPPGLQQVERARLRGDDPGLAEAAERERAEAVRVADRVHRAGREDQERVGAFHLAERVDDLVLERARRCPGEEMEDHLGVRVRLKDRAVALHVP